VEKEIEMEVFLDLYSAHILILTVPSLLTKKNMWCS
jgi:hypothetical protein